MSRQLTELCEEMVSWLSNERFNLSLTLRINKENMRNADWSYKKIYLLTLQNWKVSAFVKTSSSSNFVSLVLVYTSSWPCVGAFVFPLMFNSNLQTILFDLCQKIK